MDSLNLSLLFFVYPTYAVTLAHTHTGVPLRWKIWRQKGNEKYKSVSRASTPHTHTHTKVKKEMDKENCQTKWMENRGKNYISNVTYEVRMKRPTRNQLQWLIEDVCHAKWMNETCHRTAIAKENIYCFRCCDVRARTLVQSRISFGPQHIQNVPFNDLIHENIRSVVRVRLGSNSYLSSTSSFVRSSRSYNLI